MVIVQRIDFDLVPDAQREHQHRLRPEPDGDHQDVTIRIAVRRDDLAPLMRLAFECAKKNKGVPWEELVGALPWEKD
jgi:hypothetical protein